MNALLSLLIPVLEGLFVLGVAGSAVVLILTLIEDSKELFHREEAPARANETRPS